MKTRIFTSGILMHNRRILILKRRADDVRNPSKWDCVGGHFLKEESGEDCMLREAREETGLDAKIKRYGKVFEFKDRYGRAVGLPYLLASDSDRVTLTEHTRYKWVRSKDLRNYDCVREIRFALRALGLKR